MHHIAWASRDEDHLAWQERVRSSGGYVTDVRDRDYFQSIYFRIPSGILFEIATLSPGFAVDEDAEHLGEALRLPKQHEHLRDELEATLRPVQNPRATGHAAASARSEPVGHGAARGAGMSALVYQERPAAGTPEGLLVLHHGRGADEHDLLGLADVLDPERRLHVVTPGGPLQIPGWPGKHWYVVPRVGFPDHDTFQAAYAALARFHDETWERTRHEAGEHGLRRLLDGLGHELLARARPGPPGAGGDHGLQRLHPDRRRLAAGPRSATRARSSPTAAATR